jgi:hypothetical protein
MFRRMKKLPLFVIMMRREGSDPVEATWLGSRHHTRTEAEREMYRSLAPESATYFIQELKPQASDPLGIKRRARDQKPFGRSDRRSGRTRFL